MATLLGKIAVVTNLALSLVLAGLALGIYTNRVDWSGPLKPVAGEAAQGEVDKRKAEFQHWLPLAANGRDDWGKDTRNLLAVERQRPENQKWYTDHLDILEGKRSNGAPVTGPITEIGYDAKGQLLLDNAGRPQLRVVNNLRSRQTYLRDLASRHKAIDNAIENIADLQKQRRR